MPLFVLFVHVFYLFSFVLFCGFCLCILLCVFCVVFVCLYFLFLLVYFLFCLLYVYVLCFLCVFFMFVFLLLFLFVFSLFYFRNCIPTNVKKSLYIALIRSQLVYGSQLWRSSSIKEIISIERIPRRTQQVYPKYYHSNYKETLISLKILPLTLFFELNDFRVLISNYQNPITVFQIPKYVAFSSNSNRSAHCKLVHTSSIANSSSKFYSNHFPRQWNSVPPLELTLPIQNLKIIVTAHLRNILLLILTHPTHVHSTACVLVIDVF